MVKQPQMQFCFHLRLLQVLLGRDRQVSGVVSGDVGTAVAINHKLPAVRVVGEHDEAVVNRWIEAVDQADVERAIERSTAANHKLIMFRPGNQAAQFDVECTRNRLSIISGDGVRMPEAPTPPGLT